MRPHHRKTAVAKSQNLPAPIVVRNGFLPRFDDAPQGRERIQEKKFLGLRLDHSKHNHLSHDPTHRGTSCQQARGIPSSDATKLLLVICLSCSDVTHTSLSILATSIAPVGQK